MRGSRRRVLRSVRMPSDAAHGARARTGCGFATSVPRRASTCCAVAAQFAVPASAARSAARSGWRWGSLLVSLVAFALLRMPAALITVAVLGLPLLFVIYLREADAFRDLPPRVLALTAVLGIGLGVGWVLLTRRGLRPVLRVRARRRDRPVSRCCRRPSASRSGGVLLMLVPVVVVRLIGPPTESPWTAS